MVEPTDPDQYKPANAFTDSFMFPITLVSVMQPAVLFALCLPYCYK